MGRQIVGSKDQRGTPAEGRGTAPGWRAAYFPVCALQVELEFLHPTYFRHWFHGSAIEAYFRNLLDIRGEFPPGFRLDAPESGRVRYAEGERYRIGLTCLPGSEDLLARALVALERPSGGRWDPDMPLRANLRLAALSDLLIGRPVTGPEQAVPLNLERLDLLAAPWCGAVEVRIRLRSPLRLEREPGSRDLLDERSFEVGRFLQQLDHSLRRLAGFKLGRTPDRAEALPVPDWELTRNDLVWMEVARTDAAHRTKPLGGLLGSFTVRAPAGIGQEWARHLVLGQLLGFGKSTGFGLGRIRLETPDGHADRHHAVPARSHLQRAITEAGLRRALSDVNESGYLPGVDGESPTDWLEDPDRLGRLRAELLDGSYRASVLFGMTIPKKDGTPRPLAVPTVRDRVAQRAVVLGLRETVDRLLEDTSYAYRRGLSRASAAQEIESLREAGFRFVLEADVEDFFDTVDWARLDALLEALLGPDEPCVPLLQQWVRAPVLFQGKRIERDRGLPQGAVVSPLLSNLFLDRFDERMREAGFRLVRFADDLLVLCREERDVERARQTAEHQLGTLGLRLNPDKTGASSFDHGFRYLGYLFCRSVVLDVGGKGAEVDALLEGGWPWRPSGRPRPLDATSASAAPAREAGRADTGERFPVLVLPPSARVSTETGRLVIQRDEERTDVPWAHVSEISLVGLHHATGPALREALIAGIPVHFLAPGGRLLGTLSPAAGAPGASPRPWRTWLAQATAAEDGAKRLAFAREVVAARLLNARVALGRQEDASALGPVRDRLESLASRAGEAEGLDELLGIEGMGTKEIYAAMAKLVAPVFEFRGRDRRPPDDPINAMLSFGYTLLHAHLVTAVLGEGLLPWIGLYHESRGDHAALASDLEEELRYLVELLVLRLVHRKQVAPTDFLAEPARGVRLSDGARRLVVTDFQEMLSRPVQERPGDEPASYRSILSRQAGRVAALVTRGEPYRAWRAR